MPRIAVTSPSLSFEDYPGDHIPREALVSIMVGDLQRLREENRRLAGLVRELQQVGEQLGELLAVT